MQKLGLNELREKYLQFFESKGHLRLPSFSLVPQNDPSILLINAGMTPLKKYFTGEHEPPRRRVTTCQKCMRTTDIENVGKTARHGAFFEMLGNFSFGEYFKKEAIPWAWEFITGVLEFPVDKLWISIYEDDDEAYEIWHKDVGIPGDRIVRLGKKDNFWEHGTGPCGPCSEIYFDRGAEKGCGQPDCKVGCDCDRYMEFWNLVFTQYNKDENGNYTLLEKKNIDTGMGLERLACLIQGVNGLFEVDTIRNILNTVCKIAGVDYGADYNSDVSIRLITDHVRSTTMMVSDGILPSNEGRGYVLRRILRRAARHGRLLGIEGTFLHELATVAIKESGQAYPELIEKEEYIKKVIKIEEERFSATIDQGLGILNDFIEEARKANSNSLSGSAVFKLHDTYGFPLDLTKEIAEEKGFTVDETGFEKEMEEQRKKAREALKNKVTSAWEENIFSKLGHNSVTEFKGYELNEINTTIEYIIKDGISVENAQEGDEVTIILGKTTFYAESGGQTGDRGWLKTSNGTVRIDDCKKTPDGKYLHIGIIQSGIVEKVDSVKASIDTGRRLATARNHTSTHLLHRALRNAAGSHINQSGSLVEPDRLRFDFTHFSPLTPQELKSIEIEVNERILDNLPVVTEEMGIDEARKLGATALFGEKYGSTVRVVKIGDYSMELCGGTHLGTTSQAGLFKIVSEGGVAAGIRRIEALTGAGAIEYYNKKEALLEEVASALKANPSDTLKKIENLTASLKNAEKEIGELRSRLVGGMMNEVISGAVEIKGIKVAAARFDQLDLEALRNTGDILKNKLGGGVVVLGTGYGGKVGFVVMAARDAVEKGAHAGNIIREVAAIAGGGGGGRPEMAQAGGRDVSKIDEALKHALVVVEKQIKDNGL